MPVHAPPTGQRAFSLSNRIVWLVVAGHDRSVREYMPQHMVGWERAMESLRQDGWTIEMTCPEGPVQLEGRLPTGEPFYFRSRHQHASLGVGGGDPAWDPAWEEEEGCSGASHLPGERGLEIIRRLARSYAEASGRRPRPPA